MRSLGRQVAAGVGWMVLMRLLIRALGLISTLVLVRLLLPEDFGLVAIGMSLVAFFDMLRQLGVDLVLIQKQTADRLLYHSAWTVKLLISAATALVLVILAVPASDFFVDPRLSGLIYVLALAYFLEGLENIWIVDFRKNLQYHLEFRFNLYKKLVGFLVTLVAAWYLRSYWALALGYLATSLAGLAISFMMHPGRPGLSLKGFSEIFHFSKWLFIGNLFVYLNHRGVELVLGKLAGPADLGRYTVSYELSNLPTTELLAPMSRAAFPGYSKVSSDLQQTADLYLKILGFSVLLGFPAACGIYALSDQLVSILLGQNWLEAIPLIEVLAIIGGVRIISSSPGAVFIAMARPQINVYLGTVSVAIMFSLLFWLVPQQGVMGAVWALMATLVYVLVSSMSVLCWILRMSVMSPVRVILRPVLASVLMIFLLEWLEGTHGMQQMNDYLALALLIIAGVIAYFAMLAMLWQASGRPEGSESILLGLLRERLGSKSSG